ncbi:MAG: hypothetical protein JWR60_203 [Polaromonas sp.]|nr:hypothetical protein [Polaromonas sp.]
MFSNLRSTTPPELVELNTRFLIKVAQAFDIPMIQNTVGVDLKVNGPTRGPLPPNCPVPPSSTAAR